VTPTSSPSSTGRPAPSSGISVRTTRSGDPTPSLRRRRDPSTNFIPEGLPGAGNIQRLDNQGEAEYLPVKLQVTSGSRVLEIDPVTMHIVWEYQGYDGGRANWSFWTPSSAACNACRMLTR
jgi:hypothetical protein